MKKIEDEEILRRKVYEFLRIEKSKIEKRDE